MTVAEQTAPQAKMPMLTRGLRVEIVKPMNATWDEVGPLLRTQRSIMHRLYTASALAAIEADRCHRRGQVAPHPQTAAYQAVEEELEDIQGWARDKLKKKRVDNRATLERLASLRLSGGAKSGIASVAWAHVGKWKKDKGKTRVPTWKHGAPIPCRATESAIWLAADGAAILKIKLTPKGSHDFVVRAGTGAHWGRLRALASDAPGVKRGDVKVSYDVRQKKWFAVIAYSEPKPQPPEHLDSDHVMVLHRGQRNLLVAASTQGRYVVLAHGSKLREFKRRMANRRRQVQGLTRAERGKGASGHGRKRRYQLSEALSDKEARYVHTLCQQIGARVAQLSREWGAGTVVIEDYCGIEPDAERGKRMYLERFPNHELKECISWSLAKSGVKLGTYPHEHISQECPRCGAVHENHHNKRTGVFHCAQCAFDRPVDFVSALHALRRANGDAGEWEAGLKAADAVAARLRKTEED